MSTIATEELEAQINALISALDRLHEWYRAHARVLPWRATRDPYAIWVSEVMLQQTQVSTVIPYYQRWMARFPTLEALAIAEDAEVLRQWQGLGYYRRARWLLAGARQVVTQWAGQWPLDAHKWSQLSGMGAYTVAAVGSIAFGMALAAVDGNVRRVVARLLALAGPVDRGPGLRMVDQVAARLIVGHDPGMHNQAMMELGATVCLPRRSACGVCPLREVCKAKGEGHPERYPIKRPAAVVPHQHYAVAVVLDQEQRVLLYQRPYGGLLAGLWDFPAVLLADVPPVGAVDPAPLVRHVAQQHRVKVRAEQALPPVKHAYSHLKVTLHPFRCLARQRGSQALRAAEQPSARWIHPFELDTYAMPRAGQKIMELYQKKIEARPDR